MQSAAVPLGTPAFAGLQGREAGVEEVHDGRLGHYAGRINRVRRHDPQHETPRVSIRHQTRLQALKGAVDVEQPSTVGAQVALRDEV